VDGARTGRCLGLEKTGTVKETVYLSTEEKERTLNGEKRPEGGGGVDRMKKEGATGFGVGGVREKGGGG